jgi:hypothetical protein
LATLADEFIAAAAVKLPPALRPIHRQFRFVAEKIKCAQRFVITPDVRIAIRALLSARPSAVKSALPFARLPYPCCWFEWVPPADASALGPGQISCRKVGALLEQMDGPRSFKFFTAWAFSEMPSEESEALMRLDPRAAHMARYGVSSMQAGFDFEDLTKPPWMLGKSGWVVRSLSASHDRAKLATLRDDKKNGIRFALKDEEERAALISIEERAAYRVMEEIGGYEMLRVAARTNPQHLESALRDVSDELGHLIATLVLMNSKNCIDVREIAPPPKLNKARLKAGKTELLPYSTVEITLNRPSARAAAEGRGSEEAMRLHLVRGHFKIRKTGVFWWHHFMRGDESAGMVERKGHVINVG